MAWGGFTLIHWEFPGALATLPFVAFFLLFSARGEWRALPFATALLFLSGYTQFAYYAAITGAAFAVTNAFRRRDPGLLFRMGAAAALGLTLASPQILASWQIVRESIRSLLGAADAREHLLTPVFLLKFLIPDFYDKTVSPYIHMIFDANLWPLTWNWLNTFYVGVAAIPLAAAGLWNDRHKPDVRAWTIAGLLALAIAMGVEPFFTLLRRLVPGLRYMTHFSNAMLIALLAVGALAARELRPKEKISKAALWVLAAGASLAAAHAFLPLDRPSVVVFPNPLRRRRSNTFPEARKGGGVDPLHPDRSMDFRTRPAARRRRGFFPKARFPGGASAGTRGPIFHRPLGRPGQRQTSGRRHG
jgi:hypothetical protein